MSTGKTALICTVLYSSVSLALAPVSHADDNEKSVRTGYRWLPIPQVNFNSDTGLGYGLRFEVFNYGHRQKKPYESYLRVQFYRTNRGIDAHRILFDLPWIRGSRWRVNGGVHIQSELNAPWYGVGQDSEYVADHNTCADRDALKIDPDVCPDNPDFRGLYYYSYRSFTPRTEVILRYKYNGPWQFFGGHRLRFGKFNTHYQSEDLGQSGDSRLLEDLAAGEPIVGLTVRADGSVALSRLAEVQLGFAYDTRDHEPSPTAGSWHEVSVRLGSPLFGGQFWYWGLTANARHYRALDRKKRLVLGLRTVFDAAGGDVPFYHLSRVGGMMSFDALGGYGSVRGLSRNRYVGKVKLVANGELRIRAWTFFVRDHRIDLGAMVGIDAGRVWGDVSLADPLSNWQVAALTGFRGTYDDSIVLCADYGRLLNERSQGAFLRIGHMY